MLHISARCCLATLYLLVLATGTGLPLAEAQEDVTQTAVPVGQQSTPTPTPEGPTRLVVWMPDVLWPVDNNEIDEVLAAQIEAFEIAEENVVVDLRRKKADDVGGIMSTLRTARDVAPGALPDLTLVRRPDLLSARRGELIESLEGQASSAIIGDLFNVALQLGQIDGELFGLPYMLEVHLTAYRNGVINDDAGWRFEDVLARDIPYVFPAGRTGGLSDVFFVQYVAAGGTLPVGNELVPDEGALRQTFQFYDDAHQAGIIDERVLNYTKSADYGAAFADGSIDIALVTSTLYLTLLDQGHNLRSAPLPTASGEADTFVNGWMWVLTTSSPDRQALAVRFLNAMMVTEQQGHIARSIHMLPSQRTAFQNMEVEELDKDLVNRMLSNAILPLSDEATGPVTRAMQSALVAVISDARSAGEATQDVLDASQSGG